MKIDDSAELEIHAFFMDDHYLRETHAAQIAITGPTGLDIFADFCGWVMSKLYTTVDNSMSSIETSESMFEKTSQMSNTEKCLFILGLVIVSVIPFLPLSVCNHMEFYLCAEGASTILLTSSLFIYLQRRKKKFFTAFNTTIIILIVILSQLFDMVSLISDKPTSWSISSNVLLICALVFSFFVMSLSGMSCVATMLDSRYFNFLCPSSVLNYFIPKDSSVSCEVDDNFTTCIFMMAVFAILALAVLFDVVPYEKTKHFRRDRGMMNILYSVIGTVVFTVDMRVRKMQVLKGLVSRSALERVAYIFHNEYFFL